MEELLFIYEECFGMQYSIGVEYALHCLVYLFDIPEYSPTGIKELSFFQGILDTYLSKIFSKLSEI
jgi:DNA-binding IscR family transcriptional regulator